MMIIIIRVIILYLRRIYKATVSIACLISFHGSLKFKRKHELPRLDPFIDVQHVATFSHFSDRLKHKAIDIPKI